jgi:hypothetical protein
MHLHQSYHSAHFPLSTFLPWLSRTCTSTSSINACVPACSPAPLTVNMICFCGGCRVQTCLMRLVRIDELQALTHSTIVVKMGYRKNSPLKGLIWPGSSVPCNGSMRMLTWVGIRRTLPASKTIIYSECKVSYAQENPWLCLFLPNTLSCNYNSERIDIGRNFLRWWMMGSRSRSYCPS